MAWGEIAGYMASGLVLATFCMRTMIPLRVVAIASNVAFIAYGLIAGLIPILVLHVLLLPLNLYRTLEMVRLLRRVRSAARGDLSLDWLKPFMKAAKFPAGHVLFRQGDNADRFYLILAGTIRLAESGRTMRDGEVFGEIGLFSPNHQRTQTAVCETAVDLLWIAEEELAQLCYQNPGMAFYLMHLIVGRLLSNTALPAAPRADERPA